MAAWLTPRRVPPVNSWGGVADDRVDHHPCPGHRIVYGSASDIDEIRGHRYLIVVVDHDTGRLVWAGPGRSEAALNVFFDELTNALLNSPMIRTWLTGSPLSQLAHRTPSGAPTLSTLWPGQSKR